MSLQSLEITIPNIKLNLEQLLAAIRQLDEYSRSRVAQVLLETKMNSELTELIKQLASIHPVKEISDADIDNEIKAVRQSGRC